MIEVNLLPGGRKRSGGRKFAFAIPQIGRGLSLPPVDVWTAAAAAAVVVLLLGVGWLSIAVAGQAEELEVRIVEAERHSVSLAEVIRRSEALQARRDSIARRVAVIQEIDGARYLWPHILDEVGRALPDFIWLTRLFQTTPGENPTFRIEGRAGTYFALTTFMENLEASPFIRGVRLISSEQVRMGTQRGGGERLIYQFELEAARREPPPEVIETVPLFGPSVAWPNGPSGPNGSSELGDAAAPSGAGG